MKTKSIFMQVVSGTLRLTLLTSCLCCLTGCATWTGTVDHVATRADMERVDLTQNLESSGFKLKTPDGWIAQEVPQAQADADAMVGLFVHPEYGAALAVFTPRENLAVKFLRKEVDRRAEKMLPGAQQSDGPFSLGRTALSPMYIRYIGESYRQGDLVKRQVYGGWNLARGLMPIPYVMIMLVDETHTEWGKRQFISMMKGF